MISVKGNIGTESLTLRCEVKVFNGTIQFKIRDSDIESFWIDLNCSIEEIKSLITNACLVISDNSLLPDTIDSHRLYLEGTSSPFDKYHEKGGIINQFGVRVPNPCQEIDMQGRDMDKIGRWIRPEDKYDDATLDRLNAIVETSELLEEMRQRKKNRWLGFYNLYGSHNADDDQS